MLSSSNLSRQSGSIDYGEFHKVAADLLGDQTEYKKTFDIHTSYKALKKALDRANEDFWLFSDFNIADFCNDFYFNRNILLILTKMNV